MKRDLNHGLSGLKDVTDYRERVSFLSVKSSNLWQSVIQTTRNYLNHGLQRARIRENRKIREIQ